MLFNYIFYKYYVDSVDSYPLASMTVSIGMSIGLLCVLLIPIDIFLITDKAQTIEKLIKIDITYFSTIMYSNNKLVKLVLYGCSLFVAFFLVPFAYFYGDERIEDIQPQENEIRYKICNSLKFTVSIF
jgi:LMBR1 domain-containing protein 1